MKESPIKTERKTLHLPEDTVRALNKLAAKNGTDFSKEVRRAIDEYLDLETTAENIDMISALPPLTIGRAGYPAFRQWDL